MKLSVKLETLGQRLHYRPFHSIELIEAKWVLKTRNNIAQITNR